MDRRRAVFSPTGLRQIVLVPQGQVSLMKVRVGLVETLEESCSPKALSNSAKRDNPRDSPETLSTPFQRCL